MATLALKRSTVKSIQESSNANKDLLSFVNGSKTMPAGGVADSLSIAKLNQFGFNLQGVTLYNEIDETTFAGCETLVEDFNAKGHEADIISIEKCQVATYDDRGKKLEETADAICVKSIVTVKEGSEVKDVRLNIVLRSKSTAANFLQSFKVGEMGVLQLQTSIIATKPQIWGRIM